MYTSVRGLVGCSTALVIWVVGIGAVNGDDRLVEAVKTQDQAAIRALLEQQVDVNAPQADGATALHWAAYHDDVETARLLVLAEADANAQNELGVRPLSLACGNGNAVMVELLVKAGADPNAALSTGETPLMTAARTGKVDAVRVLLESGAEVNAEEPVRKQTALMWAVSQKHTKVAELLIEHGADIHAQTKTGFNAFLFAAREGDLESIKLLLDAGADVNSKDRKGTSALLTATVRGHSALAIYLLEKGAYPDPEKSGYTALHWAAGSWETEMTGPNGIITPPDHEWSAIRGVQQGKHELIRALLEHGADPNALLTKQPPRSGYTVFAQRPRGSTPFALAAMAGDVAVMQMLVDAGADPLIAAKNKTTPLMMAAGVARALAESRVSNEASLAAVKLAVKLGADVNAVNDTGDTALHGAARIRSDAIVQFLVDNGAEVNVKNNRGQSPLFIAERYFHPGSPPLVERTSTGDLLRKLSVPKAVREAIENWDTLPENVRDAIEVLLAGYAETDNEVEDDPYAPVNQNPVLPERFAAPSRRNKK